MWFLCVTNRRCEQKPEACGGGIQSSRSKLGNWITKWNKEECTFTKNITQTRHATMFFLFYSHSYDRISLGWTWMTFAYKEGSIESHLCHIFFVLFPWLTVGFYRVVVVFGVNPHENIVWSMAQQTVFFSVKFSSFAYLCIESSKLWCLVVINQLISADKSRQNPSELTGWVKIHRVGHESNASEVVGGVCPYQVSWKFIKCLACALKWNEVPLMPGD